jgi:hypothetical protein
MSSQRVSSLHLARRLGRLRHLRLEEWSWRRVSCQDPRDPTADLDPRISSLLAQLLDAPLPTPGSTSGEPVFDQLRALALIHEERQRIRELLIALSGGPRPADLDPADEPAANAEPEPQPEPAASSEVDELLALLEQARVFLLRHPIASQAVFTALVAEGRRFAATDRGSAWAQTLARAPAMTRAREVWEATSLNLLTADEQAVLPSTWVEALLRAVELPELDRLLTRLHVGMEAPK